MRHSTPGLKPKVWFLALAYLFLPACRKLGHAFRSGNSVGRFFSGRPGPGAGL